MSSTENNYVNTDLGNVALNSCGEYNADSSYEYLDTVNYEGGSYFCKVEFPKKISGIAPKAGVSTEFWQLLTIPGDATSEYIKLHDEVVNKAKKVETSRAAVELSQTEVEAAQADVSQMRQDTQEAAEEAASSRDSAAGYAQSAETSRTAAKESEDNINAQVTEFDTHVAEKTSAAETAITEARRAAVNAVSTKQDDATQAVTDEGDKQIKNVEDAGTEQIGKAKSAGASAVSAAGAAGVSAVNAVKAQQTASIKAVADEGTQQVTAVNTAGSTQVSTIETKGADQVKAIQEASENALQNISNGVDKGLSEEGKAADAKATGEAISNLTEDLSNKITKFYASNLGETHLADSDNGKIMDMMLYGKSEQKQYSGKNLLEIRDGTQTTRGITITAKDGVVALKGTATETGWAVFDIDSFVLDGTCILSSNISTDVKTVAVNKSFKSVLEQGKSVTLENAEVSRVCFTVVEGKTYDISNILLQIEKGSVATSYEPYTGGIPSPNPSYPQEIKSVVNPIVKVCGKNLWNPILGGYISNTDGSITANLKTSSAVTDFIKTSGKDITVIARNFSSAINNSYAYRIGFYDARKKWIKNIIPLDGNKYSINTFHVTGTEYIRVSAPFDIYDTIQIEKGSEATPYEPYTEQFVQLPYTLNAVPVTSGGNVTIDGQQYIADYVDVERGKIVKCVEKYRIPSSLNWIYEPSENDRFGAYNLNININPNFSKNTLFTHYQNEPNGVSGFITPGNIRLHNFQGFTDVTNFKEWLDKNESYAYFVKNTLEEIDLTIEEIQIFKALSAYYPATNISVNSEQLKGYTVFNYPISMANGWNYVKQQLNDNRDYIYDMDTKTQDIDTQAAEAYVNSEYAVALTELEA